MAEKIFVFGAGGHAKVVIDMIEKQGKYEIACLLDDSPDRKGKEFFGYPVAETGPRKGVVAIGDNAARGKVADRLVKDGCALVGVVHPSAQIARGVEIGGGTVIMAGAVVNSDTKIGKNVIVNTGATVDHDCVIGDLAFIAPGCSLCGGVKVGSSSFLGVGTRVIPGATIGRDVFVAAGSVVTRDVPDGEKVAGAPARRVPGS
ncbi:MAG: acetyltransferase [Planctomycetota bacterium]|jgi:sugar O-acyltransferase (sialic acid O-acetyltransferase NeuD family)